MQKQTLILLGLIAMGLNMPVVAQTNAQVAKEVIGITKAQWAAEMKKQPAATSMRSVADEYTEFNPGAPTRLDGKDLNMRLVDAVVSGSGQLVAAEMANESVQVYGDVAILSYNFIGMTKDKDGKIENFLAKSTRVYVKQNRKWMLVHANFASVE